MKQWQFKRIVKNKDRPRLYVATGKDKGNFGKFQYESGGKIYLSLDSGTEINLHYSALEELDEFGDPKVLPVMDMTGREIVVDSYVCYSVKTSNTHALEIGKVLELTRLGGLKARSTVRNGERVPPDQWRHNVVNVDPVRCIKLPVDDTTMLMWLMQDFAELVKSK
jgi:hypothetical protein